MAKKKSQGNNIGIFLLLAIIIIIPLFPFLLYFIFLNKAIKKLDSNLKGYRIAQLTRSIVLLCALAGSVFTIYLIIAALEGSTTSEFFSIFPTYIPFIDIAIKPVFAPFLWCYVASIVPLLFFISACISNYKQQKIEHSFIIEQKKKEIEQKKKEHSFIIEQKKKEHQFIRDLTNTLIKGEVGEENIDRYKELIDREKISPDAVRTAFIHAMTDIVLEILAVGTTTSATVDRLKDISLISGVLDNRPVSNELQKDFEQTVESCQDVILRLICNVSI